MRVSAAGRKAIAQREGVRLRAYKDSKGIPTIGVGHTSAAGAPAVRMGMVITQAQCDEILTNDLADVEDGLNSVLKVKVTQNQFDAMASVAFNVGPKFYKSTCIRKLNAGDIEGAADAILLWNKPDEIIGRRQTEYKQFMRGAPASMIMPIAAVPEEAPDESEDPIVEPVDPVAKASSLEELQNHLKVVNQGIQKVELAADSSIIKTGMKVVQGGAGLIVGGGVAVGTAAATDETKTSWWDAINARLDAVPGLAWLIFLALSILATILITQYMMRERVKLQQSGRVLPTAL